MWLLRFTVMILSSSFLLSTGTTVCKVSLEPECINITRIVHLVCLMEAQVTVIEELLQLFKESQLQIVDISDDMKHRFDYQESALDQLLETPNSSIVIINPNSTQPCAGSIVSNGTGVIVNSAAMERNPAPITSCQDLPHTDQALLQPLDGSPPFWVLCVQKHTGTGSGWVVIQQRLFGKVNFFRPWIDYREGFGSLSDEFWLGLENIHRMTRIGQHELMVEMADFKGNYKYARYLRFEIGGEDVGYALRHLGSYSGTAGDSLRTHVGVKFFTFDNDNASECALKFSSGWWFRDCFAKGSNLNGPAVYNSAGTKSINWHGFSKTWISLKYSRMMLRAVI